MRSDVSSARYLVIVLAATLLLFALMLASCIALARFQPRGSFDFYQVLATEEFGQHGKSADLLFVGDSSLLYGVKPKVVSRALGMRVRSLPLYGSAGLASYELLLDDYLAHNRRPKIIVFYVAAQAPVESPWHSFEKTWTLLKFGDLSDLARAGVNPYDLFFTALHIVKNATSPILPERALRLPATLAQTDGFFPIDMPPLTHCNIDSKTDLEAYTGNRFADEPWDIFAAAREKYRALGIKVLTYISPMPACDVAYDYFRDKFPFSAAPLRRLPNGEFVDYNHLTDEGASRNSQAIAQIIGDRLKP